jgi:hypothetical protein
MATIHAMFALNWLTGFRGEDFKTFFPIRSSAEGGHLGWRCDPDSKWPLSADIVLI